MTDEPRRIRRRRRSPSFAGGGLSSSTDGTLHYGNGEPEHDDEDINGAVMTSAAEELLDDGDIMGNDRRVPEPHERMESMQKASGRASNAQREYRLKLLHRALMRNVAPDQIAQQMRVSVRTVQRDREELYRRLREEAKSLDVFELIGKSMGFYEEVKALSMRAASGEKIPLNLRISALRTALSANNDMHKFLNTAGVYDVLRFKATEDNSEDSIRELMDMTENLMGLSDDGLDSLDLKGMLDTYDDEAEEDDDHTHLRLL